MLAEKGYVYRIELAAGHGEPERAVAFPRGRVVMAHDASGRAWRAREVLMAKFKLQPTRPAARPSPDAVAWAGAGVPLYTGELDVPRGADWRFVGQPSAIWYDRTGTDAGAWHHPFDPGHARGFPKLFFTSIHGREFWRLDLGPRAVFNERGFVKP